jgi:hypothetical protein
MKKLTKASAKTLDTMIDGIAVGDARTIDNKTGFMAVHVDRLSRNCYSIAHYYEQNGDLVPDPDLVVWRAETGDYVPVSLQLSSGHYSLALRLENDQPVAFAPALCRELASFANMMVKNIKAQQGGLAGLRRK